MRTDKVSLKKQPWESRIVELGSGNYGKMTAQIYYVRSGGAPTGKIKLLARTDPMAPFIPARAADGTPIEIDMNQLADNGGADVIEFEGAYADLKFVYEQQAGWIDPNPQDQSVSTNYFQIYYFMAR